MHNCRFLFLPRKKNVQCIVNQSTKISKYSEIKFLTINSIVIVNWTSSISCAKGLRELLTAPPCDTRVSLFASPVMSHVTEDVANTS